LHDKLLVYLSTSNCPPSLLLQLKQLIQTSRNLTPTKNYEHLITSEFYYNKYRLQFKDSQPDKQLETESKRFDSFQNYLLELLDEIKQANQQRQQKGQGQGQEQGEKEESCEMSLSLQLLFMKSFDLVGDNVHSYQFQDELVKQRDKLDTMTLVKLLQFLLKRPYSTQLELIYQSLKKTPVEELSPLMCCFLITVFGFPQNTNVVNLKDNYSVCLHLIRSMKQKQLLTPSFFATLVDYCATHNSLHQLHRLLQRLETDIELSRNQIDDLFQPYKLHL